MNPKDIERIQRERLAEFKKPCTGCGGPEVMNVNGSKRLCLKCYLMALKVFREESRKHDFRVGARS